MFRMAPSPDQGLLEIIAEISRATRIFQQESVFCEGLTFNQFTILDLVLKAEGRLSLSELRERLEVEKSTVTRLVAPLIKRKLLARRRSRQDSRAAIICLTDQGRETWEGVRL